MYDPTITTRSGIEGISMFAITLIAVFVSTEAALAAGATVIAITALYT